MPQLIVFFALIVTILVWYAFAITCEGKWSELRAKAALLGRLLTRWQARLQARMWMVANYSALDEQVWTVPEEKWSPEVEAYFEQHYVEGEGDWE